MSLFLLDCYIIFHLEVICSLRILGPTGSTMPTVPTVPMESSRLHILRSAGPLNVSLFFLDCYIIFFLDVICSLRIVGLTGSTMPTVLTVSTESSRLHILRSTGPLPVSKSPKISSVLLARPFKRWSFIWRRSGCQHIGFLAHLCSLLRP